MEIEGKNDILLITEGERDTTLLKDYLSQDYNIFTSSDFLGEEIDLIITDPPNLSKYKEIIKNKKESTFSVFLPCILIVDRRDDVLDTDVWDCIDEVVASPVPKVFLKKRIESLIDRRRKSLEIKEIKEDLETRTQAIDEAPVGVILTDPNKPDNPIVYANKKFQEITGYNQKEILGRNCRFLQGPNTNQETVKEIRKSIDNEEVVSVDILNYRRDESQFWNRLTIAPVKNDDSELINFIGFQEDITQKKHRQQELERYERIIEASGDPVYTLDEDGEYIFINERFCDISGYSKNEVLGSYPSFLYREEDIEKSEDKIKELLRDDSKDTGIVELELRTKDGDAIPVQAHIALLPFDDGEFQGTTGVIRDISDRKRRERRLQVLTRVLRHDLLNTMNIILTRAEILRDIVPENEKDSLDVIIDNVNKIVSISKQSREIEKLIKRKEVIKESIDLVEIIMESVVVLRDSYPDAIIETDLPNNAVVLTNSLIGSAIDNLIENAIEHNPKQNPWVKI